MCLGIPGRVVGLADGYAGQLALVDVEGAGARSTSACSRSSPATGQWVLIHMGFAVEAIDEAQARAALSGLQLMGSGRPTRVRRRYDVFGLVQGVGFRPFVYVTAADLGLAGSVANTSAGVVVEVEGDPDAVDRVRSPAGRATRRRWPRSRASTSPSCPCGAAPASHRGQRRRRRPHPRLARRRDLRRLPGRARRPDRPALPPPVHHRAPTAVRGSRSSPRCPTTAPPPRWPASRCATPAARSTTTPPTVASTRSRSPATTAVRRSSSSAPGLHAHRRRRRTTRRASCSRRAGSSPSRGSAATTSPATRATSRPSRSCAGASGAATSRSR